MHPRYPLSFIISLYKPATAPQQKQLQGCMEKHQNRASANKLGCHRGNYQKMPTRYKSELPEPDPCLKEWNLGRMIGNPGQYPGHKRFDS